MEVEAWNTEESGAEKPEVGKKMESVQIRVVLHLKMRANNRTARARGDLVTEEKRVSEQWTSRGCASGDITTGWK